MNHPEPNITVKVDVTNPGQFFACCGLLELADRLWPGAEAWFVEDCFSICCNGTLTELIQTCVNASLEQVDADDDMASPMRLGAPFNLTLDWWKKNRFTNVTQLKVWAGSMRGPRITRAMQHALKSIADPQHLFEFATVVYDPDNPTKKVEPFYFDSRRGRNARSLDIGFAPDSLKLKSVAFPAVEFLCLIGLQRTRPTTTNQRRQFDYYSWAEPLPICIAAAGISGSLCLPCSSGFRFRSAFRTDQKKHKAFLPATPLGG